MKLTRNMIAQAVQAKIITEEQAKNLIEFIKIFPNKLQDLT